MIWTTYIHPLIIRLRVHPFSKTRGVHASCKRDFFFNVQQDIFSPDAAH